MSKSFFSTVEVCDTYNFLENAFQALLFQTSPSSRPQTVQYGTGSPFALARPRHKDLMFQRQSSFMGFGEAFVVFVIHNHLGLLFYYQKLCIGASEN